MAESDIANCFEAIPHARLMSAIEERIVDRHVLKLLRAMLRAGVMQDGAVTRSGAGTPQGGVISPVPVQRLPAPARPAVGQSAGTGVLVRYADDLLVMCQHPRRRPRRRSRRFGRSWPNWAFELKDAKTRIVHLREGGEGLDFLGFHHRWVRATPRPRHVTFLARWPSRQAMQHARDRVREITARERLLLPVEEIVQDLNRFLRGWAGYFRYGNSARHFDPISDYALEPARAVRGQAPPADARGYGWSGRRLPVAEPPRA